MFSRILPIPTLIFCEEHRVICDAHEFRQMRFDFRRKEGWGSGL